MPSSTTWLHTIINFDNFAELLPLVSTSIVAAVLLGVMAGFIGPMVQARDMAFAVHGTAELSFAGAACALWLGSSVTLGAVIGAVTAGMVLGIMGIDGKTATQWWVFCCHLGLGWGCCFYPCIKVALPINLAY